MSGTARDRNASNLGRSGTVTNHTHTNTHTAKPCKKLSSRGVAKADATNRHLCARIPDPCRVKKTLWSQQHAVCICISYSNCCQQLIEICAVCPSVATACCLPVPHATTRDSGMVGRHSVAGGGSMGEVLPRSSLQPCCLTTYLRPVLPWTYVYTGP